MIHHVSAVVNRLEEEIEREGGQRAWARKHDLSPQFINDVLQGRRSITDRLADALGFERVTTWRDKRDTGERGYRY